MDGSLSTPPSTPAASARQDFSISTARFQSALDRARSVLWGARTSAGHWEGELSSSALSTATAVGALALAGQTGDEERVRRGLRWLIDHANSDGGWGDTVLSVSNISTTTLCWAAFFLAAHFPVEGAEKTVSAAEVWLTRHAGSLTPDALTTAILQRYGRDRTFSVPILTMCALSGRLGEGAAAWRRVMALPFELAALPQGWFTFLRLPVVSYALPALIAIGLVRHHQLPSRNPLLRRLRQWAIAPTLAVLERIQPCGGGFLEATPLTSFVTMSLIGAGQATHPVVQQGLAFLRRSLRPDGSWPIDTNLATWVTTLSLNALQQVAPAAEAGNPELLRRWILSQQYRQRHPYTNAAPGGWAWTDLPGGVPDADDTAGALLALGRWGQPDAAVRSAVLAGCQWLMQLQNRDGGIPTFCRGWGALAFDRSSPDLTAHALRAWWSWREALPEAARPQVGRAVTQALAYLEKQQRADGAWVPLWFGNQHAGNDENPTYGTARVVLALADLQARPETARMRQRGVAWLLAAQQPEGGWAGGGGGPASVEETALALEALAAVGRWVPRERSSQWNLAVEQGTGWLVRQVEAGTWEEVAPIGFYFARLWYYEKLYPVIFTVAALEQVAQLGRRGPKDKHQG